MALAQRPEGRWGPDRDTGMSILGGCPPTGNNQARRAPYSLPPNSAALPRTLSYHPVNIISDVYLAPTMCQDSGTLGWEIPAFLFPAVPLSPEQPFLPSLTSSRRFIEHLLCLRPVLAVFLSASGLFSSCAHTLPSLSLISSHFHLPLSLLANVNRKQPERSRAWASRV